MIQITLDDSEKKIAMALARARYANSRKNKLKKTELPKASVLDPDIEGVMSELALCKYLGVYPDQVFEIGIRSVASGTDRGDIVFDGVCIDVKSTKHANGRLFSMKENEAVDVFVLLTGRRGNTRWLDVCPLTTSTGRSGGGITVYSRSRVMPLNSTNYFRSKNCSHACTRRLVNLYF